MSTVKILLVDDHELFRSGMKSILQTRDDFEVMEEAASGEEAIDKVRKLVPDLVLMDVNMPGIGGTEATRRLQRTYPDLPVIAVTALDEDPFPNQLLDAGAHGFLTKATPADELFEAITSVMRGNYYISRDIAQKLALSSFTGKAETSALAKISPREMQVMVMIAQGKTNGHISDALFLSPKTISTFRSRLFEKLDVSNDVELTHVALRYHLIDPL